MSIPTIDQTNFADWIEYIAAKAGLATQQLSERLVVIQCPLGQGRMQTVWISPVGQDPLKNTIISISSPALKMGTGQWLSQQLANDLLRQNARMMHGSWAIDKVEGDDYLVVFDTQIAETLDTQEFAASVRAAAILADEMERDLASRDNF
jgi:hypothetical protein